VVVAAAIPDRDRVVAVANLDLALAATLDLVWEALQSEAILDRDMEVTPGQDTAAAANLDRAALEDVAILDRDAAEPKSVAKLPVAKRSEERLSREDAANLDQERQEVLANLDQGSQGV
jgi:hypothetical protein